MKKLTLLVVMAVLCSFLSKEKGAKSKADSTNNKQGATKYMIMLLLIIFYGFAAIAQENRAIDITKSGLQIGDKVPDITITNLHNYKDANGKPATSAKLSDFKGKLLILDFWATWCSPCVAMIPKMDSLQKQFGNKIQFLSVTYQAEKEVLPFLEKLEKQYGKHYDLPVVTDSKVLNKLFPHVYLPHYVWINGDGLVNGITNRSEINTDKILAQLGNDSKNALLQKQDFRQNYTLDKPLFVKGGPFAGNNPFISSELTYYIPGFGSGKSFRKELDGSIRITCRNLTIQGLYRYAYGQTDYLGVNRTILEVKELSKFIKITGNTDLTHWKSENSFCYELVVDQLHGADIFKYMVSDLDRSFYNYRTVIEKRNVKCLLLQRTSSINHIGTKGASTKVVFSQLGVKLINSSIYGLVRQLNMIYLQKSKMPIVDDTGFVGNVDLDLHANLADVNDLNLALKKYDLKLVEGMKEIDMLVIRDRQKI